MIASFIISCQNEEQVAQVDPEALYVHEVLPLFESKCIGCHGQDEQNIDGGLNLRNYENLLTGGNSGKPAIVPFKPQKSLLLHAVNRVTEKLAMPPKEGDKLSASDVQIIYQWLASGAPVPTEERMAEILADTTWSFGNRRKVRTSGGLSDAWNNRPYETKNLWAFQPLKVVAVPSNKLTHPIDAFLEQRRKEQNLAAAPPTSKRLLIRRATIDLTGLPPTVEDIDTFLADESADAFEQLIERLLSSPHYGEQWGRHWLDVVRYADSGGFANDFLRPNAWRYRDYVIRSFNEDKPYHQFIEEQIAGDELQPEDPEHLIATGFLRMGPWEHTFMSVKAETRQTFLDDVTNIVGETFLSIPLNCAKCHDHKYDPIPTKDYYGVQAVFATTQFADRPASFLPQETMDTFSNAEKQRIIDWIDQTEGEGEALMNKEEAAARRWFAKRKIPYKDKKQRRKLPDDQQPPRYYGLTFDDLGYRKVLKKRLQLLSREKEKFEPLAFAVYNGPERVLNSNRSMSMPEQTAGKLPQTYILSGGSVYAPLEPVQPSTLSVLTSLEATPSAPPIPNTMQFRRSTFAQWLTDDNPLVLRSIVNRVWKYHFGTGLVKTPNNFGATGEKPTHPELLDWLANYFVEHGWSFKALHQLIMTSEAYQMASQHPEWPKIDRLDPDNQWLSYFSPRRLEAEELKDALLFISGELNLKLGGIPVYPEINQEIALQPRHTMGSVAPAYQPSRTPEERNRRTIYSVRYRNLNDPDLEVFNQPSTALSCEHRDESTVTPQVFILFNGSNVRTRALAFANHLKKKGRSLDEQLQEATTAIWGRPADHQEIAMAKAYLKKMLQYHQENEPPRVTYPAQVKREMVEEMTGTHFTYEEELEIYKNYVPDVQLGDVAIATRALADFIAILFNSNEFVYVY